MSKYAVYMYKILFTCVSYLLIYLCLQPNTFAPQNFRLKLKLPLVEDAYDAQHQVPVGRRNGQPHELWRCHLELEIQDFRDATQPMIQPPMIADGFCFAHIFQSKLNQRTGQTSNSTKSYEIQHLDMVQLDSKLIDVYLDVCRVSGSV